MSKQTSIIPQLHIMLELQNNMNQKVNKNWQTEGFAWYRAIWVECAELMDHYGWKWWKQQSPDTDQVALELIDIWHFGLSLLLQTGESADAICARIENELVTSTDESDFRCDLEAFTAATLADKQFHINAFARLMAGINMDFDTLYSGYIGKNVLNFFRQDHGYQDGSYRKLWHDGREDNEHLVDLIKTLDSASDAFKHDLYDGLSARYEAK